MTTEVVAAHDGHLGRLVGDGVLIYFGYPMAQEDDAERAVRAALGILDAVAALPNRSGQPLAVRIGISTGLVVVADVADTGDPRNLDIFGETPNLAARLQALAEPGTALVSDSVRRLVGALFAFRDLGTHPMKGWPDSVPVWQVLGVSRSPDRFAARAGGMVLPMLGRDAALDRLRALWRSAQAGAGRAVLVVRRGRHRQVAPGRATAEGSGGEDPGPLLRRAAPAGHAAAADPAADWSATAGCGPPMPPLPGSRSCAPSCRGCRRWISP